MNSASRVGQRPFVPHKRAAKIGDIAAAHATDCDYLVGTYDYACAARLIGSVHTTTGGFAGRGPYLVMIIADRSGMQIVGLDGSVYADDTLPHFVAGWSQALAQTERQVTATPDRRGLVRSVFDLVAAILTTVTGGTGGLIKGLVAGL
jgi:hypothetical protein